MTEKKLSKKMRMTAWLRWAFADHMTFSFDRAYVNGWTFGVLNELRYLYEEPQKLKEALQRTRDYWLCEQTFASLALGIYTSMEEAYANGAEFDSELIRQVKSSLMGPLSGIGDSLMGSTIRQICLLFFLGFAMEGSLLAPIGYFVLYMTFDTILALTMYKKGYELGRDAIGTMLGNRLLQSLTKAASVMAVLVIGGMAAKYTTFTINLVYEQGESLVDLQKQLDSAIPGLIPLVAAFVYYYLVKKKVNYILIILGTLVLMIGLYFLGIL